MNQKKSDLEPKYEEARSYVIKGSLLNLICRALRRLQVVPGDGLTASDSPHGRILSVKSAGGGGHPFQLVTIKEGGGVKLYVYYGGVSVTRLVLNVDNLIGATGFEAEPTVNGGACLRPPALNIGDGAAGYLDLAFDQDYGIWLRMEATGLEQQNLIPVETPYGWGKFWLLRLGPPEIVSSTTSTSAAQANAASLPGGEFGGHVIFFLGSVAVDADGLATITPFRRSDICVSEQMIFSPTIVSTNLGNAITVGDDGGAFYTP